MAWAVVAAGKDNVKLLTNRGWCYKIRQMVTKLTELRILGKVEINQEATAEEKAGILSILAKAGLYVYQEGQTIYIQAETCNNIF